MWLSPEHFRRQNDPNYHIALERFLQEEYDKSQQELEKELKEKPWLKRQLDRQTKRLNALRIDEFIELINKYAMHEAHKIVEFNKKWDKENYKTIHAEQRFKQ